MQFQLIQCLTCAHLYKWCDERYPNYCPECGCPTHQHPEGAVSNGPDPRFQGLLILNVPLQAVA